MGAGRGKRRGDSLSNVHRGRTSDTRLHLAPAAVPAQRPTGSGLRKSRSIRCRQSPSLHTQDTAGWLAALYRASEPKPSRKETLVARIPVLATYRVQAGQKEFPLPMHPSQVTPTFSPSPPHSRQAIIFRPPHVSHADVFWATGAVRARRAIVQRGEQTESQVLFQRHSSACQPYSSVSCPNIRSAVSRAAILASRSRSRWTSCVYIPSRARYARPST